MSDQTQISYGVYDDVEAKYDIFEDSRAQQEKTTSSAELNSSMVNLPDSELPVKRGWLKKKTRRVIGSWQSRYIVLKDKKFMYYHQETDTAPAGIINFDQITVDVQITNPEKPTEMIIIPLGSKRKFRLRAENPAELTEWALALYQHIESSQGKKSDLVSVSRKVNFWKFDRISEQHFRDVACTGDLLLFRGKSAAAKLQRGFTRSKYDHVAMILRYSSGLIALLEATAMEGVALVFWDDFMRYRWHLLYSRLVYRHLEIERTDEMLTILESFINEVKGKPYRITPSKIFTRGTNTDPGSEKTFFCSELVASAYKRLELLTPDLASCKYWPGNFSDEQNLELTHGSLGEELLIDFDVV